jgi:formylmethanofuran--tetrahydromethanopterin N-formyltransferase
MMRVNDVEIEDTFAEAFGMTGARVIITAINHRWAEIAAREATGYATSVIACDCEAGIERFLEPDETPDGRPGISCLFFAFSRDALQKALVGRMGQCVMTCATAAVFNGLPLTDKTIKVGNQLRFFGDGWQSSKKLGERRFWRVPVMEGEFLVEERFGTQKGVAGGNFLILGHTVESALAAAEAAVEAMRQVPDQILPFPGGIVRSGSKVGSRYKFMRASTNEAYCPTLSGRPGSALPEGVNAVLEIVIDGLTLDAVRAATRAGVLAAAAMPGIARISAGNYGGGLGPHLIHLREVLWPEGEVAS